MEGAYPSLPHFGQQLENLPGLYFWDSLPRTNLNISVPVLALLTFVPTQRLRAPIQ